MLIPSKHNGWVRGTRLLFKKDAPAQDPRFAEAALAQIELARQQYSDYRTEDMPWIKDIANRALGVSESNAQKSQELTNYQLGLMKQNDARYQNVAIPFEDQLLSDVNRFDSDAYKQQQVDQAQADVNAAFSNANQQQMRGLSRMGVNPNSGKFAAMTNQNSMAQATALATAANKTRQAAEQVGLSTKMQMYGGMKGLAGLGATNAQLGLSSMGTGNQSAQGMTGAAGSYLNANNNAMNTFSNANTSGINAYNNLYNSQVNAFNAQANADPTAALLGAGAQMGAAYLGNPMAFSGSDRRLKTAIVLVGRDERTGLNLYEFAYKQEPSKRFIGVMADEVQVAYPHAVITMADGYMAVNYRALGLEMVPVDGETA